VPTALETLIDVDIYMLNNWRKEIMGVDRMLFGAPETDRVSVERVPVDATCPECGSTDIARAARIAPMEKSNWTNGYV